MFLVGMILGNAFREYIANFRVALAFGLLLLFVPVLMLDFFQSQNLFFSSGSFFVEYKVVSPDILLAELLVAVVFLVFFSFFVSLMVFGIRKDLSKVRVEYYLSEMVQKFTVKIFLFFLLYSITLFALGFFLVLVLEPGTGALLASLVLLVVSLFFLFVPQAIVVDEVGVFDAVKESLDFVSKNVHSFFTVIVVGSVLLAIILLLEFALDFFVLELLPGRFVSAFLLFVFLVPFLEALKTYLYMFKFDLVKKSEMAK